MGGINSAVADTCLYIFITIFFNNRGVSAIDQVDLKVTHINTNYIVLYFGKACTRSYPDISRPNTLIFIIINS